VVVADDNLFAHKPTLTFDGTMVHDIEDCILIKSRDSAVTLRK